MTTTALPPPTPSPPYRRRRGHHRRLDAPRTTAFWESTGKTVARRNLIWSIFSEHLGFSVWLLW